MYTAEKIEGDKFKVKISLTAQEWNEYVNEAYEQNKGKFSVQGFRKGKVPKKVMAQTSFLTTRFNLLFLRNTAIC